MSDSNIKDEELKRKRPKEEVSVKKETRDRDFKCEKIMMDIIEDENWTDFTKEQCRNRLNDKKIVGKFFVTLKNDLNKMINEQRLFIYNHTNLSSSVDKKNKNGGSKQLLLFTISSKKCGNTTNKFNHTKQFEPDQTESKYYAWFSTINRAILNECDSLNRIERAELKRLIDQVEQFCEKKFDKISYDQLIESDLISKTSIKDVLSMYKEKKNEQVIEWLERRIEQNINNDIETFYNDIITDLDFMIEKRDVCLPVMFTVIMGMSNGSEVYQASYNRKINGKQIGKMITINFLDIDKFELYRMLQLVFEWFQKIQVLFSEAQQKTIDEKIQTVKEAIDNE